MHRPASFTVKRARLCLSWGWRLMFGIGLCALSARGESREEWLNSLAMEFRAVDEGVLLCVHETRVRDFAAFVEAGGLPLPEPNFAQGPEHPVVNASWEDAQRFCAWLTATERAAGAIGETQFYRLPTEVEWEAAAGVIPGDVLNSYSAVPLAFSWGANWPPPSDSGNFSQRLRVDDFPYTSPVKSFPPNAMGFYDLSGNVWEWCQDVFEGAQDVRVLKGGSWRMHEPSHLALNRSIGNASGLRLPTYGFRLALVEEGAEESRESGIGR